MVTLIADRPLPLLTNTGSRRGFPRPKMAAALTYRQRMSNGREPATLGNFRFLNWCLCPCEGARGRVQNEWGSMGVAP